MSTRFNLTFRQYSLSVQSYIILKNTGGLFTGEYIDILCTYTSLVY